MKKAKTNKTKSVNGYVIAGIVAFIIAVVGYVILVATENAVLGKYDKTAVYIAREDIKKGTQLTEDMFAKRSIDTSIVPQSAVTDISKIKETYTLSDIPKRSVLCDVCLQDINEVIEGDREVGINIADVEGAVNGILRTSDYVDIYVIPKDYKEKVKDVSYSTSSESGSQTGSVVDENVVIEEDEYGNKTYIVNDVRYTEEQYKLLSNPDMSTKPSTSTKEVVPNISSIKPTYKHIYVKNAFNKDGEVISNSDTESVAMRFNILMDSSDADDLIGSLQTSYIYITINRDESLNNPNIKKDSTVTESLKNDAENAKNKANEVLSGDGEKTDDILNESEPASSSSSDKNKEKKSDDKKD